MLKTTMTLAAATMLLGLSVEISPQGHPEAQWTAKVGIAPEAQAGYKGAKVHLCCTATPTQPKRPAVTRSLKRPKGSTATDEGYGNFRWWWNYSGGR